MRTSLFVYIACLAVGVTTASAQDYSELLTASFPADATWLITNPSFETGDETGWTLIGKDPNVMMSSRLATMECRARMVPI